MKLELEWTNCTALISRLPVIWRWQLEREEKDSEGGRREGRWRSSSAVDQYILCRLDRSLPVQVDDCPRSSYTPEQLASQENHA